MSRSRTGGRHGAGRFRVHGVLAVLLCLPAAAPAQGAWLTVRGRVLTAGGPLPGAAVLLIPQVGPEPEIAGRADPEGAFELRLPASGDSEFHQWVLEVDAAGLARRLLAVPRRPDRAVAGGVEDLGGILLDSGRTLSGEVRAGSAGLAGTRISLWSSEYYRARPWTAVTDAAGRYTLPHVPAGSHELVADHPGHAPGALRDVEVPEGSSTEPLRLAALELEPAATLSGRVVDAVGRPIPGGKVVYWQDLPLQARDSWLAPAEAVTGEDGAFLLERVAAANEVYLSFGRDGFLGRGASFTPIVTGAGLALAEPVVLQRSARLSGRVVDPSGDPVAGANVYLVRADSEAGFQRTAAGPDGSFLVEGLEPGGYRLSADARGFGASRVEAVARAGEPGPDPVEVFLTPIDSVDLAIAVRGADGEPVSGAKVSISSRGSEAPGGGLADQAYTDDAGRVELRRVPAERLYYLTVDHPEHPRFHRPDQFVATHTRELEVRLDPAPWKLITVSGRVISSAGQAVVGASVALHTLPIPRDEYATHTESDGSYRLERVKEGLYRLDARAPGYAGGGQELRVAPETAPIQIVLETGATLAGAIRGLSADELRQLVLDAATVDGSDTREARIEDGEYRIDHLRGGDWQINAWVAGTGLTEEVTVLPGKTEVRHDVVFPAFHELAGGLVVDGRPLAGAGLGLHAPAGAAQTRSYDARTDDHGRFRFPRVAAGSYELSLYSTFGNVTRRLDVPGEPDLTWSLRTARLRGQVVDAGDGRPVTTARTEAFTDLLVSHGPRWEAATGADGWFEIGPLFEGEWRLITSAEGYLRREEPIEVAAAGAPLTLELSATPGLTVEVRTPSGQLPHAVEMLLYDESNRQVARGHANLDTGPVGHWPQAPAGRWRLRAGDKFSWITAEVEIPGPPVTLSFPAAGHLRLVIPALILETPDEAHHYRPPVPIRVEATLEQADLAEYRGPTLRRGRTYWLHGLRPGVWSVEVRAEDGRFWTGTAVIRDRRTTKLLLD